MRNLDGRRGEGVSEPAAGLPQEALSVRLVAVLTRAQEEEALVQRQDHVFALPVRLRAECVRRERPQARTHADVVCALARRGGNCTVGARRASHSPAADREQQRQPSSHRGQTTAQSQATRTREG